MDTVKEALIAARQLLVDVGWVQGDFSKSDSAQKCIGYCAAGALYEITQNQAPQLTSPARQLLGLTVESLGAEGLLHFNDTPGRTKEEVLALFDRAIEAAS